MNVQAINRRTLLRLMCIGPTMFVVGCDEEKRPDTMATVFNNEKVHAAMQAVESQAEELATDVDRFDTENWRDVVPDVKTGMLELEAAIARLRRELYPE